MAFKPSHGVRLAEVFEYLASTSQVRSSLGGQLEHLKYGTEADHSPNNSAGVEQGMIDRADLSHCVSELEKQQNVHWAATDVLPRFALRARLRPGAVAVACVRAYQPWHGDPDLNRPAGSPACGVDRGPDRGLAEVYSWMRGVQGKPVGLEKDKTLAQSFKAGGLKNHKEEAARMLADADIVVGAWIDLWNDKAGFCNHISVAEFVAKYGTPLSTVLDWCAKGKLDAVIVGNAYRIDVSDLVEPTDQP